jgi:hypothetical protein
MIQYDDIMKGIKLKKQVGGRLLRILNPAHCYLKFKCRNASVNTIISRRNTFY